MLAEGESIFQLTVSLLPSLVDDRPNKNALLLWWDTLRPKEEKCLGTLKNGQIVNRIPNMNLICRKAPLARLLQRMQARCSLYDFFPRSFILPTCHSQFVAARGPPSESQRTYILKPDGGALGIGITILDPGATYEMSPYLYVAQEYIESALFNGFKFDFRIYVLVASVDPKLEVFVYQDGICRVCSEPASANTPFARVTNTALNKKKSGISIQNITKMISEVLPIVCRGVRSESDVWNDIYRLVALTIISGVPYLTNGIAALRQPEKSKTDFACFQLLGFDVILDRQCIPRLLEVNYRPSLGADIKAEEQLKHHMMLEVLAIAVRRRIGRNPKDESVHRKAFPVSACAWDHFFRDIPESPSRFRCVFSEGEMNGSVYGRQLEQALAISRSLPTGFDPELESLRVPCVVFPLPARPPPGQRPQKRRLTREAVRGPPSEVPD
jgi:hypothetical protein